MGENFWHGRALCSLSRAWLTFGDARAEAAIHRGLDVRRSPPEAPSDVRALHLEVGLRLIVDAGRGGPRAGGTALGARDRGVPRR